MKKLVVAVALSTLSASAMADIGMFAGLSYAFGAKSGVGFTLQATSSRKEDQAIVAAGVSVYPFAGKPVFGVPIGVGYQGDNVAGIVNYDVLLRKFSVSAGYANTRDDSNSPPPVFE